MDFDNTIQAMQSMGFQVVKQGKRILRKKKKRTKSAGLEKGFNYNVNKSKTGVELEFVFGKAKKYWQFVDEGVRGSGGFKGSGKARGKGSPFRFKKNNIKKGVVAKWIKNKPLRLRGSDGRFLSKTKANIESASFVIGRAIAQRGLERTQFFSKPFKEEVDENIIATAFSKDLENELEIMLEDIDIEITVKGK
tara:strand:- start:1684 stop:2262 length:579 start_codon:yes stop_codon:yes gene_type:complete